MCSSGAVINLGHADPPIKIEKAWINDVPTPHPGAAVDLYIGATILSDSEKFEYGGAHVIEDLIKGKVVDWDADYVNKAVVHMVRIATLEPACKHESPKMI